MAFSLVTGQHAYVSRDAGAYTTVTPVLPNNPTPGNLVVVGGFWFDGAGSSAVTSVLDANSNAYTQAVNSPETTNAATAGVPYLFYRLVAPANADKTVTITWASAASYTSAFIAEFTATSLPAILDTSAKGSGTGTTLNTPTVTRTGSNELMVLNGAVQHAITAANSPWTSLETLPLAHGNCLAYILDRSTDAAANLTIDASSTWDAVGMSFQMTSTDILAAQAVM